MVSRSEAGRLREDIRQNALAGRQAGNKPEERAVRNATTHRIRVHASDHSGQAQVDQAELFRQVLRLRVSSSGKERRKRKGHVFVLTSGSEQHRRRPKHSTRPRTLVTVSSTSALATRTLASTMPSETWSAARAIRAGETVSRKRRSAVWRLSPPLPLGPPTSPFDVAVLRATAFPRLFPASVAVSRPSCATF